MNISPSLRKDFLTYAIGYLLAVALTGIAFACVYFHLMAPKTTFIVVLVLAFVQVVVHLRCFLHISLSRWRAPIFNSFCSRALSS